MNVLIAVDLQNDFITGALGTAEAAAILPHAEHRIRTFEGRVFFTRDTHGADYLDTREGKMLPVPHCIKGTEGWELAPCLLPPVGEVIDKPTFGSTLLGERLLALHEAEPIESITLIGLCTDIAKQLFAEGVIREKFGRDIPVIFDDAELCWYDLEATENANPEGLADEFLRINAAAGKNSEAARSLADMLLAGMGIYIIMALFPTSLAASVMTLIFGGVMYPLTVGGFIKAALITAFMGYNAFKKAMLAGSASSADNATAFRALAVMIADVLAAAVIIFSCNFAPDRFFALLFVLLAVLYCGLSYFNMSEKMRSMSNEEKKKMSDGIKKIRGRKNNKDDKDNK